MLFVTSRLPSTGETLTNAPLVRQIQSLRDLGCAVDVVEVTGLKGAKYLQTLPRIHRAAKRADLIHAHYAYCGWLAVTVPRKPIVWTLNKSLSDRILLVA